MLLCDDNLTTTTDFALDTANPAGDTQALFESQESNVTITYPIGPQVVALSDPSIAAGQLTGDADGNGSVDAYTSADQYTTPDFSIAFTYDGLNRRTSKHYSSFNYSTYTTTEYTETYIWDGDDLLAVFNSDGSFQRYLMAPGQSRVLAQETITPTWVPDVENGGGPDNGYYDPGDGPGNWVQSLAALWAITDHLGSVQALLHNETTAGTAYSTEYFAGVGGHAFSSVVANYHVREEILTSLQQMSAMPEAFGQQYELIPAAQDKLNAMDVAWYRVCDSRDGGSS